jgi:hypothetical protein
MTCFMLLVMGLGLRFLTSPLCVLRCRLLLGLWSFPFFLLLFLCWVFFLFFFLFFFLMCKVLFCLLFWMSFAEFFFFIYLFIYLLCVRFMTMLGFMLYLVGGGYFQNVIQGCTQLSLHPRPPPPSPPPNYFENAPTQVRLFLFWK